MFYSNEDKYYLRHLQIYFHCWPISLVDFVKDLNIYDDFYRFMNGDFTIDTNKLFLLAKELDITFGRNMKNKPTFNGPFLFKPYNELTTTLLLDLYSNTHPAAIFEILPDDNVLSKNSKLILIIDKPSFFMFKDYSWIFNEKLSNSTNNTISVIYINADYTSEVYKELLQRYTLFTYGGYNDKKKCILPKRIRSNLLTTCEDILNEHTDYKYYKKKLLGSLDKYSLFFDKLSN